MLLPRPTANWAGLTWAKDTLPPSSTVRAPRSGWGSRMVCGIFHREAASPISPGSQRYMITSAPLSGVFTTVIAPINPQFFRTLLYRHHHGGYERLPRLNFSGANPGHTTPPSIQPLKGNPVNRHGRVPTTTPAIPSPRLRGKAWSTYYAQFPPANATLPGGVGRTASTITRKSATPRARICPRDCGGGIFQAHTPRTSPQVWESHTITTAPPPTR